MYFPPKITNITDRLCNKAKKYLYSGIFYAYVNQRDSAIAYNLKTKVIEIYFTNLFNFDGLKTVICQ